jgi:hypothetical protein
MGYTTPAAEQGVSCARIQCITNSRTAGTTSPGSVSAARKQAHLLHMSAPWCPHPQAAYMFSQPPELIAQSVLSLAQHTTEPTLCHLSLFH